MNPCVLYLKTTTFITQYNRLKSSLTYKSCKHCLVEQIHNDFSLIDLNLIIKSIFCGVVIFLWWSDYRKGHHRSISYFLSYIFISCADWRSWSLWLWLPDFNTIIQRDELLRTLDEINSMNVSWFQLTPFAQKRYISWIYSYYWYFHMLNRSHHLCCCSYCSCRILYNNYW